MNRQGMAEREILLQYMLCINEFLDQDKGEALLEAALERVDAHRRKKASETRRGGPRAASLGAGLLLQLAVREALKTAKNPVQRRGRRLLGVSQALAGLKGAPPLCLSYDYGHKGKPYFRDLPFYFSLSHSGEYVFCVLSGNEVGADVQRHQKCDMTRLADRFFSERENAALRRAAGTESQRALFYRLWTRKEALGKLTGGGIGDALGLNLLPGEEVFPGGKRLIWEETGEMAGYSMAVCRQEE